MKNIKIVFFSLLISSFVKAQDTLDLKQIISIGLQNNYGIVIGNKKLEIASINNTWANTGILPTINISANSINKTTNYPDSKGTMAEIPYVENTQNILSTGIALNWTIFDGLQPIIRKEKLETLEAITEGNTAALVESNLQAIILAYYKILLEREKLQVYKVQLKISTDRYEYDKIKKEFGKASTYDLLQSQNAMLQDKTAFITQELNYQNAIKDLQLLLGVSANKQIVVAGLLPNNANEYSLGNLNSKMKANNKNLRNQYLNIELMQNEEKLALREMYYPKLTMQAGAELSDAAVNYNTTPALAQINNNSWNYYGNFALTFNLYSGGQKSRASKIAQINTKIAEVQTSEIEQTLDNQLSKLFELYLIRKELLKLSNEMLAAAKLNYEMTEERYKQGLINSFNYRDVQKMYLEIAIKQNEALYNLIQTDTDLMRITGGILETF